VKIMGILNCTPDSFYDGGRYTLVDEALTRGLAMVEEGADIIDVGGESTRPGAAELSVEEELERVIPVIEQLSSRVDVEISIDTRKAPVAEEALKAGASIVNDVSALNHDAAMAAITARYDAGLVLMHMKGIPETMQQNTEYGDIISEIKAHLADAVAQALAAGVGKDKIVLDPGIGFGKTVEDNYRIINATREFKASGYPVLIGLSRKSLIGKLYDHEVDRLPGTVALNILALERGADIIRVHDVAEHRLAMDVYKKLLENR
jgi:dihydropteroate synthase